MQRVLVQTTIIVLLGLAAIYIGAYLVSHLTYSESWIYREKGKEDAN